jgi:uncharacterized protein (DUF2345 family)
MADKMLLSYAGATIKITDAGDFMFTSAGGASITTNGDKITVTGGEVRTTGKTILNGGSHPVAYKGGKDTRNDTIVDGASDVLV